MRRLRHRGFTLLEIMVVVAIVALATASVTLALRDDSGTRLEREALRLSALIESARAQSRTSGLPVVWRVRPDGFEFIGLPAPRDGNRPAGVSDGPQRWLNAATSARVLQPPGADSLVLGPEPLVPAQRVIIGLDDRQLVLSTDGLGPFTVTEQP
jgi:general secretion pathway protein H